MEVFTYEKKKFIFIIIISIILICLVSCNKTVKEYEDAVEFSEGLAGVKLNGKWGFIDIKEDLVIPCKYGFIKSFKNDLAIVDFDYKKCGCINKNGNIVIKPLYSELYSFEKKYMIAKLRKDVYALGNYGIIDRKDTVIVPFKYDNPIKFDYSFAIVEKKKNLEL